MMHKKLRWNRILPVMMAASMLMQNCFVVSAEWTEQQAEVQEEVQALKSLTSADLETGGMSAATASLKIGDWLDYGDYGIEREDVPGTTYHFYITTRDEAGNVINDQQMAYCIQSYFLTPLPGDHTEDMTDNVLSICGGTNVQKSLYYGYGGVGYDAEEFDAFLQEADPQYYADVYTYLSDSEKEELAYILTHGAASYAYFTDGTDLEEYYKLQFKIKYGDDGERQYGYFKKQELKKAGLETDDMNLLGATYGMNPTGISLARAWYDVIAAKTDPWLEMVEADGIYTFQGNEENEELSLGFVVPEDWNCQVVRIDGSEEAKEAGENIVLSPLEKVEFSYVGEAFSAEENSLTDNVTVVEGVLTGAEKEVWSLVLLETNKGNEQSVSKRQQDIAAISMIDAGKTEMDFEVQAEKGSIIIQHVDDEGNPITGAEFGVYYDDACSEPVQMNGEPIVLKVNEEGKAYLEYLINERLAAEDSKLYFKTLSLPEGYVENDILTWSKVNNTFTYMNSRQQTSVSGTMNWTVPEGVELPESAEVALMLNGEQIGTITVTAEDGWNYTFEGLQAYVTDENGNKVPAAYTVEVLPVEGFIMEIVNGELVCRITGSTAVEGEVAWYDGGDADAARPEALTINLYCDGEVAATVEVSAETGWKYSFADLPKYSEDGSRELIYTAEAEVPEGYELKLEDGQLVLIHPASVEAAVEGVVSLSGRELKPGDFKFTLVQVSDASGAEELAEGYSGTAESNADGTFAFDDLTFTEEGTYYYKLVSEDGQTYVVQADVVAGGEFGDQLEVTLTYLDQNGNVLEGGISAMEFTKEYHASGEWQLSDVSVTLENAALTAGQFSVELKDADGVVLQMKENDADGRVSFDPITFTEADIDQEYVYTVALLNAKEESTIHPVISDQTEHTVHTMVYDQTEYTVKVKVEDGEASDGTLNITVEAPVITFVNTFSGYGGLKLTDADGQPIAGAKVRLYTENENGERVPYTSEEDSLYVSDENGVITADNLAEGNYIFVIEEMPEEYTVIDGEYPFFVGTEENGGYTGGYDVEVTVEKETEVPTEEPTEKSTEVPTEEPTEKSTEAPTEEPTEKSTEAPTEEPAETQTEESTEAPAEDTQAVETEVLAEAENKTPTWSLWSIIVLIIMILLYFIRRRRNRG